MIIWRNSSDSDLKMMQLNCLSKLRQRDTMCIRMRPEIKAG